jgi:hypothetical protein
MGAYYYELYHTGSTVESAVLRTTWIITTEHDGDNLSDVLKNTSAHLRTFGEERNSLCATLPVTCMFLFRSSHSKWKDLTMPKSHTRLLLWGIWTMQHWQFLESQHLADNLFSQVHPQQPPDTCHMHSLENVDRNETRGNSAMCCLQGFGSHLGAPVQ